MFVAAILVGCEQPAAGTARGSLHGPPGERLAEIVTAAVDGRSPTALRLTGFDGAMSGRIGSSPDRATLRRRLAAAVSEIRAAGARASAADIAHAEGLAILLAGDGDRDISRAVQKLRQALDLAPDDPAIACALAAALHARVQAEGATSPGQFHRPDDLIHALRATYDALRSAPDLAEARFNLAYLLDEIGLEEQAAGAWDEYLEIDARSSWADDARRRLAALRRDVGVPRDYDWEMAIESGRVEALARRFPFQARSYAFSILLPRLADEGLGTISPSFPSLRQIARAVRETRSDPTLDGVGDAIERAERRGTAPLADLMEGHRHHARGIDLLREYDARGAERNLREALRIFRRDQSPATFWAAYDLAKCFYQHGRWSELQTTMEPWIAADRPAEARARAHWLLGLTASLQARSRTGIDHYLESLALLELIGDRATIASMQVNLAGELARIGDSRAAWRFWIAALRGSRGLGDPRVRHIALYGATLHLHRQRLSDLAVPFVEELVGNATAGRHSTAGATALASVETLLLRAETHRRAGRAERARQDLAQSRRFALELADPLVERRVSAYQDLEEAASLVERSPKEALACLERAQGSLEQGGEELPLVRLHTLRAAALLAAGSPTEAANELEAAISRHGRTLSELTDHGARSLYLQDSEESFESLLRLQAVDLGQHAQALVTAERARGAQWGVGNFVRSRQATARTLEQPSSEADLAELLQRIPMGVTAIEYVVLQDRTLLFVVQDRSVMLVQIAAGAAELRRLVERFRTEIQLTEPRRPVGTAGAQLYDLLIRPLSSRLAPGEPLIVIPDRSLFRLSFPALYDRQRSRYLIEDRPVLTAPSLTMLSAVAGNAVRPKSYRTILAVGGPSSSGPAARPLPRAIDEAEAVANLYAERDVLTVDEATERAVRYGLATVDVFHFAGHAIFDPEQPEESRMVFSDSRGGALGPEDDGVLVPDELAALEVGGLRLVVLSACSTLDGMSEGRSTSSSWAERWLAVGVPTVVAAQWEVYDEPTSRLMTRFHRALQAGEAPMHALRSAQLAMLSEPAVHWAGFQVHGRL